MKPVIVKSPRAQEDLFEIASHIATDSMDAALGFLAAAEQTLEFLTKCPGAGRAMRLRLPDLRGLRRWSVRGYPVYLVFYRVESNRLEVVRVLHGARDIPGTLRRNV